MTYQRTGNTITITLTDDEVITMDYVDSLSTVFMQAFLNNFLTGRKAQHMDDLKTQLLENATRDQLLAAQQSGSIAVTE